MKNLIKEWEQISIKKNNGEISDDDFQKMMEEMMEKIRLANKELRS